jgi:hypothetical protein
VGLLLWLTITSFLARVLDKSSLNCGCVVGPVLTRLKGCRLTQCWAKSKAAFTLTPRPSLFRCGAEHSDAARGYPSHQNRRHRPREQRSNKHPRISYIKFLYHTTSCLQPLTECRPAKTMSQSCKHPRSSPAFQIPLTSRIRNGAQGQHKRW